MDCGKRISSAADWADLPSELLEIIYDNLKDSPVEKLRFRWVCQRWRLSTLPPPNKLAAWFPLKPSALPFQSSDSSPLLPLIPTGARRSDSTISASSVYLVRSRSDPTKSCLVSLHEASAGNLVLRHPLFYNQISSSDSDWIVATQTLISRSYAYSEICHECDQTSRRLKVSIAVDSRSGSGFVGVCGVRRRKQSLYPSGTELFAFSSDFTGRAIPAATPPHHRIHRGFFLGDFATFNGRIFAVDKRRRIYALDHASLSLVQLNAIPLPSWTRSTSTLPYLVVSDGDLYLVSIIVDMSNDCNTCQVHRLQVVNNHEDQEMSMEAEEVEDLGDDRVFFIGLTSSFSVSARDLPPPWKGNCVVYHGHRYNRCECYVRPTRADHEIIFLGRGQSLRFASVSSLEGYSDLLSPEPLLPQIKDLDPA